MEKNSKLHIGWLVTAMMVVLLIIDQIIKLYIKTHFCLGESVRVTDWFFIEFRHFVLPLRVNNEDLDEFGFTMASILSSVVSL